MTVILVVLAIFGHLIGAIFMRKTANEASDERDRQIRRKAGHLSGIILAASILMVLLATMLNPNGFFLFHAIFACLLVSQIAEYVLQIVYYRQSSAIGDVA
jgi:O-antigen/teichoic acid export membrane protein